MIQSPGCFGGEPAIYEDHFKRFMRENLTECDEVYFVIGSSLVAGSIEWSKGRLKMVYDKISIIFIFMKFENLHQEACPRPRKIEKVI